MFDDKSTEDLPPRCDVAIIGAGPAGLAAATQLKKLGIKSVLVLERESQAGGIPRHCGHSPFGMREFKRCFSGPSYALALTSKAFQSGVDIFCNTTVVELHQNGSLGLSTSQGYQQLEASLVVLATGARETPRSSRLISGQRPMGVVTTGALQAMVYSKRKIPFHRPVIIGSELVSFSALLTCRHAGIKPVAMLESNSRITAWKMSALLPRLLGIPLSRNTELKEIFGDDRVSGVSVSDPTFSNRTIDCDGVVFSGRFIPESSLAVIAGLDVDAGSAGPVVDQFGRCSNPFYVATGNLLRAVESAGWSWREGVACGNTVARILRKGLAPSQRRIRLQLRSALIKYVMPQVLAPVKADCAMKYLQLRFNSAAKGRLSVTADKQCLWSRKLSVLPERRVLIPISRKMLEVKSVDLEIDFEEFS